jgi:hypothetical protein
VSENKRDLSTISIQQLKEELALRNEAAKLRTDPDFPSPLPADQINLQPVIEACNCYLAEMRAKGRHVAILDHSHQITMKVMEAIYGPKYLYPFMARTLPL